MQWTVKIDLSEKGGTVVVDLPGFDLNLSVTEEFAATVLDGLLGKYLARYRPADEEIPF